MDTTFTSPWKLWHILALGVLVRCFLLWVTPLAELCRSFVAFSTPITSWKRYEEGLFLYARGLDPYANSLFHQSPLFLPVFSILPRCLDPYVCMLWDTLTAYAIAHLRDLRDLFEPVFVTHPETRPRPSTKGSDGRWVAALFLLNPMTITACLSMEVGVFERMWLVCAVLAGMKGDRVLASLFLAVATELGTYPVLLAPFIALLIRKKTNVSAFTTVPAMFILILAWGIVFHVFYNQVMGLDSFSVMKGTVWTILTVPVLSPNLGIFWYFFLEVFLPFRSFFIVVFQCHALVYVVPLLVRYGKELPLFSVGFYLGILAALKSYPTVGDYALWIAFITIYADTWKYYRYPFVSLGLFLSFFFLTPIMFILWKFEAGNANFFYGLNLILILASQLLLSDYSFGMMVTSLNKEQETRGDDILLLYLASN